MHKYSCCPITIHFTFLMSPQIQNNIHENNYLASCRSCWSSQRFSSNITSDVFHCHAPGKESPWMPHHPLQWSAVMSSHTAFMTSNRDIWILWSMIIYFPPHAEKNSSIGFRNESMVEGTPLLSFHVQQPVPNNAGSVEADIIPRQQQN